MRTALATGLRRAAVSPFEDRPRGRGGVLPGAGAGRTTGFPWPACLGALLCAALFAGWAGEAAAQHMYPQVSVTADKTTMTEGDTVTLTLTATPAVRYPLGTTVGVLLTQTGAFFNSADMGLRSVTIPFGATSATLAVSSVGDMVDERSGQLTVFVLGGSRYRQAEGGGSGARVAVVDDDVTDVTLTVTDGTAAEDGTDTATLTVELNRGMSCTTTDSGAWADERIEIPLSFTGGAPGTDFSVALTPATGVTFDPATNTVVFSVSSSSGTTATRWNIEESATRATLTLTPLQDDDTVGETVSVSTGTVVAGVLSGGVRTSASGQFTIVDDDATGSLTGGPVFFGSQQSTTVTIAGGGAAVEGRKAKFTLRASPAPTADLAVRVRVRQKGDYAAPDALGVRTVVIPAGEETVRFTVATVDDATPEPRGWVKAQVRRGAGYAFGEPRNARVRVRDNDGAGSPAAEGREAALSVSDAQVREGRGAALAFTVSLDEAPGRQVRVSYATRDATARAGEDYLATVGTLLFGPSDTEKTVMVPVLDDAHDEGAERLELVLSDADGARIADGVAVGTIENEDPMPAVWLARLGRTVAEQALGGIAGRMGSARTPGFEGAIAGQALSPAGAGHWAERGPAAVFPDVTHGFGGEEGPEARSLSGRDALLGSAFALTGETDGGGGTLALWGRAAHATFDGREGETALDGEVTSALLGADYARGDWLFGLALSRSVAEGGYADAEGGAGKLESSLTAAIPWAALQASERLTLWSAVGHGAGEVTLRPDGGRAMKADTDWTMAAAGLRGDLLAPPVEGSGPALSLLADALWARTGSEKTTGLVVSESDATRLRLGIEAGWPVALDGGGSLTPKLEAGIRHDGGDAETGLGVELGGGIAWRDAGRGLSLDLSGRVLLAHEDGDLEDRGLSASLGFDPDPATERGPSLSLRQELGNRASGGLDALFAPAPLEERSGGEAARRWTAEAAWGFPAFGGRFTGSPHVGFGLAPGTRDYSLGWRLAPEDATTPDLTFGVRATRRESDTAAPEHTAGFEVRAWW